MRDRDDDPYARLDPVPSFGVRSDDVVHGEPLAAAQYAPGAGGSGTSPHLAWSGLPAGTRSIAVTMLDPDAPTASGFWHWALADLPATTTGLPAGVVDLPGGAVVLENDLREPGYTGAAPPQGTGVHRYYLVVHAVDVLSLGLDPGSTPAVLGLALHLHTLGRAILVATAEFGGADAVPPAEDTLGERGADSGGS